MKKKVGRIIVECRGEFKNEFLKLAKDKGWTGSYVLRKLIEKWVEEQSECKPS